MNNKLISVKNTLINLIKKFFYDFNEFLPKRDGDNYNSKL